MSILYTVRTLLCKSGLPDFYWAEAGSYAVCTRTRCPSGPSKKIPEDPWRGTPAATNHLNRSGAQLGFGSKRVSANHARDSCTPDCCYT